MPNTGEVINMNANQPQGAAPSLRGAAFIAGIAYLIAIFATPYAWINPLIDVGDSAATPVDAPPAYGGAIQMGAAPQKEHSSLELH